MLNFVPVAMVTKIYFCRRRLLKSKYSFSRVEDGCCQMKVIGKIPDTCLWVTKITQRLLVVDKARSEILISFSLDILAESYMEL